ncbi:hypothetical protein HMPREF2626_01520 [Aerococcus sp. HMSC062A02]|uniref:ArpU family phage packaging/lysis transcriptional regulator n=1 Tax=Aerococcus sp. HMSC062A02 TaxID=1715105 RepID=UPI0008B50821|nr:ArpU family phage packaging/lysis transcriptional regulator [Aerococcus sp. HMSC062A02]OFN02616.1 hypothetical protein HMPREF2626_01520 [Aerococcus sp. HMSC062A02]
MLFPEIDKEKTLKNVTELLSNYDRCCLLAGVSQQKMVASFSDIPSGSTVENTNENKLINGIGYQQILNHIHKAIDILDWDSRQIIIRKYLKEEKDVSIYNRIGMSESTYYKKLEIAKLKFANAYEKGSLVVLKNGGNAEET